MDFYSRIKACLVYFASFGSRKNPQRFEQYYLVMFASVLLVLGAAVASNSPGKTSSGDAFADGTMPMFRHPGKTGTKHGSNWHYREKKDELRDSVIRLAQIDADGAVELGLPYGEQRLQILIGQSSQSPPTVLLGVQQGQIMCNSYLNSTVKVRFDRGPVEAFRCGSSLDGRSNMAIIRNPQLFLERIRKSERLVVEADFVNGGTLQSVFSTGGFDWD